MYTMINLCFQSL